uniref:Uncharacterized protein n=1 Tax=Steinernema glaseri TaxID=37863 RepID=A0A1I8AJG2_9BILA
MKSQMDGHLRIVERRVRKPYGVMRQSNLGDVVVVLRVPVQELVVPSLKGAYVSGSGAQGQGHTDKQACGQEC